MEELTAKECVPVLEHLNEIAERYGILPLEKVLEQIKGEESLFLALILRRDGCEEKEFDFIFQRT